MNLVHPQVLWLAFAAVPALAGFLFWAWKVKQKLILQFLPARLAPGLLAGVSPAREKVRMGLLVAAVAAILCVLARPQWGYAWEEARLQGLDIIVAIDASRSMLARDVVPNRIEKTKLAVMDLMRLAKTDRLGLIVFAGEGFLQAPLTTDDQAFQQSVEAVSVGIVPVGGTSLSSAILTALQAFGKGNDNHKVLVFFTDGEDHDADTDTLAAAKEAAEAGMRIFTIGVGTPEGTLLQVTDEKGEKSYVKDDEGHVIKSSLNERLLRQIATDTGGFYLPLQGGNPMETLYTRGLAPLPKSGETTRQTRVYQEQYRWFLGFAILCLVIEALLPERPRPARARSTAPALSKAAAALVLLLIPYTGHASPSSAFRSYKSKDYKGAFKEYNKLLEKTPNDYRLHYNAGAAAYQLHDYTAAAQHFANALNSSNIISSPGHQEQAYYNLGNTFYHLGESEPQNTQAMWQNATNSYSLALQIDPKDTNAAGNLSFVKKQLEELKKQQQQQQQQNQNQQQQKQQDKDQNNQQQQQQDQKQQQQKQQQDQQSEQQKKDEQKARQEQAKKEQEKKQQQAKAGQNDQKEKQEAQAAAEARMSPEEARKLLDQSKDDAKVLVFSPTNQPGKLERGKFKDW